MERYVSQGKSAGMLTLLAHKGKIIHLATRGYADIASKTPVSEDTIFRIYSMTKPITSVALMSLMERGKFHLDDAASAWIPALGKLKVYAENGNLQALRSDITFRQLLTHTAGFSYGFTPDLHPVDKMYSEMWKAVRHRKNLQQMIDITLEIPLIAQPGEQWNYSIATDICGYLVELMSDMPFGDYLQKTIFSPLDMTDTAFEVSPEKQARFATLYGYKEQDPLALTTLGDKLPYIPSDYDDSVALQSGGGGLVSTANDYWRFAQMMLNRGELDGNHILGRKTVEWMTSNHLPQKLLPIAFNGIVPGRCKAYGFGLGYCINIDPALAGTLGSAGDYGWGGLADTYCWCDPQEKLVGILMQQYIPSLHHAGRRDFRNAVYQALL